MFPGCYSPSARVCGRQHVSKERWTVGIRTASEVERGGQRVKAEISPHSSIDILYYPMTWTPILTAQSCRYLLFYFALSPGSVIRMGIVLSPFTCDSPVFCLFFLSQCFAVRSLGWVEIPEEDLTPGKSSIAVNNCIQQLSHSKCEGRDAVGAWGEGQDMVMILKKDTLSLVDPVDHSLIHCQPIINIRVWGVGCNNGRDFAFVASDKDTCMLKCHVFRCDVPAKAIAATLHEMCSKIMAERAIMYPSVPRSLTMESISPEDLPLQVDFLEAVRESIQKFQVLYIGHLPVPRAMGMEVLNRAIENVMSSSERSEWEPITIHVSDTVLSLWKGEDGDDPFWECQVRYLTFLGIGKDTHTFAVIVDAGRQRFECHVFWCDPDAGSISEAVQAACMVQYQKCLVAQTPPVRSKISHAEPKVKRATSMDSSGFLPSTRGSSSPKFATSSMKKGMLAFFETFKNKQAAVSTPQ
ncbi:APBB3 protein, partial [Polypterus senegalus]